MSTAESGSMKHLYMLACFVICLQLLITMKMIMVIMMNVEARTIFIFVFDITISIKIRCVNKQCYSHFSALPFKRNKKSNLKWVYCFCQFKPMRPSKSNMNSKNFELKIITEKPHTFYNQIVTHILLNLRI